MHAPEDEVLMENEPKDNDVAMDVVLNPDHLSDDTPMVSNSVTVATESSFVVTDTGPKKPNKSSSLLKAKQPKKSTSQYRCSACGKDCFNLDA